MTDDVPFRLVHQHDDLAGPIEAGDSDVMDRPHGHMPVAALAGLALSNGQKVIQINRVPGMADDLICGIKLDSAGRYCVDGGGGCG